MDQGHNRIIFVVRFSGSKENIKAFIDKQKAEKFKEELTKEANDILVESNTRYTFDDSSEHIEIEELELEF